MTNLSNNVHAFIAAAAAGNGTDAKLLATLEEKEKLTEKRKLGER